MSETVERSNRVVRTGAPRRTAWRKLAVAGAVTTAVGGCSLAMQGPSPSWDGEQKPDCTESFAPVMIDGLTSTVLASTATSLAANDKLVIPAEVTLGLVGVALLYGASAARGAHAYNACRTATAIWRARE